MAKENLFSGNNIVVFLIAFMAITFMLDGTGSRETVQVQDACDINGNFCLGTGQLWKCDQKSDGTKVASLIEDCDDGYICDSRSGSCEAKEDCAEVTIPIWYIQEDECVFNEMGHGCLDPNGDGVTTFGTEQDCEDSVDAKAGIIDIVPPKGSAEFYVFTGVLSLLITFGYIYFKDSKKK